MERSIASGPQIIRDKTGKSSQRSQSNRELAGGNAPITQGCFKKLHPGNPPELERGKLGEDEPAKAELRMLLGKSLSEVASPGH